jgi:hypothetical protein
MGGTGSCLDVVVKDGEDINSIPAPMTKIYMPAMMITA